MSKEDGWHGSAVHKARAYINARLPMPCTQCGLPVQPGQTFAVAHLIPRWQRPELAHVPSNWGADHRSCSDGSGTAEAMKKAKAAESGSWGPPGQAARRPLPRSLSTPVEDVEILPTDWAETVGSLPWLADLRTIPDDCWAPRYMTGPHPQAVGTLGEEFCRWVDDHPNINAKRSDGLRWWQRLVVYRILEVDQAGRLVWRNVLLTMARQLGKSWLLRSLILWRIQQGDRFGEEQTVISIAHKVSTATEVWRPAARWASSQSWHVRYANGEQLIEEPGGGRWLVRAASDGVGVGFALSMLLADECWQIHRSVVEAADPAMTEAECPQLMLVSTAGDSSSDLFGTYRGTALDQLLEPGNTLLVEWSTPKELPIDSIGSWRMASPHWSTKRETEILDKIGKLEELEFRQNYLNQWVDVAHGRPKEPGLPVFTEGEWFELNDYRPVAPTVAAIESWFGEGLAVATAEQLGSRVGISVELVDSVVAAAELVTRLDPRPGTILVGKSLATEPVLIPLGVRSVMSTSKAAAADLRRYVAEDVIRHDSSPGLAEQALSLRTVPGADGPRVRSVGRMDAVKAAVFATEYLRKNQGRAQIW